MYLNERHKMGGRGASSGFSKRGNKYGSQYITINKQSNVKVVRPKDGAETIVETMTNGRVYGVINSKGDLGSIVYFDKDKKRKKRIDLDHEHKGIKPHAQYGYMENETKAKSGANKLTTDEKKMVDFVNKMIDNK